MALPVIKGSLTDLAASFQAAKVSTADSTPGTLGGFLKFDFKDGSWAFGRDGDDVTGDTVVVNVRSFAHGWKLWAAGKFIENLVSILDPLPEPPVAVDGKYPSEARAFAGAFYDNGKPGEQFTFETNSYGGRKATNDLLNQVYARSHVNPVHMFPIISLNSDSYKNVKHGSTIFNPVFAVVGWADEKGAVEDLNARIEASDEEPAAPAPTRRRRVAS